MLEAIIFCNNGDADCSFIERVDADYDMILYRMITTADYNTEILTSSPPIEQPLRSICMRKFTHLSHNCGVSLIIVEMKPKNLSCQDLKVAAAKLMEWRDPGVNS